MEHVEGHIRQDELDRLIHCMIECIIILAVVMLVIYEVFELLQYTLGDKAVV